MNIIRWVKHHSPTILAIVGSIGTVVTAVLSAKATPGALMAVYAAEGDANGELPMKEKVRTAAPYYIPAAIAGLSTIACILGANAISQNAQAALMSAYALLDSTYKEYRDQVTNIVGPQANRIVEKAMAEEKENTHFSLDEPQTFYEEHYGKFFELTMKQVMQAEYHINRNLAIRGEVTLNEFYDFLGLDHIPTGDELGWNLDDGPTEYGYSWIDFDHEYIETDDSLTVCEISMPFPPHLPGGEEGPQDDPPEAE